MRLRPLPALSPAGGPVTVPVTVPETATLAGTEPILTMTPGWLGLSASLIHGGLKHSPCTLGRRRAPLEDHDRPAEDKLVRHRRGRPGP